MKLAVIRPMGTAGSEIKARTNSMGQFLFSERTFP